MGKLISEIFFITLWPWKRDKILQGSPQKQKEFDCLCFAIVTEKSYKLSKMNIAKIIIRKNNKTEGKKLK